MFCLWGAQLRKWTHDSTKDKGWTKDRSLMILQYERVILDLHRTCMRFLHDFLAAPRQGAPAPGLKICQTLFFTGSCDVFYSIVAYCCTSLNEEQWTGIAKQVSETLLFAQVSGPDVCRALSNMHVKHIVNSGVFFHF